MIPWKKITVYNRFKATHCSGKRQNCAAYNNPAPKWQAKHSLKQFAGRNKLSTH